MQTLEPATPKDPLKWTTYFALFLLFSAVPSVNLHTDFANDLVDLPSRMTADLERWPFGDKERNYTKQTARSSAMRFLRRAVKDGFPIVAKWRDRLQRVQGEPKLHQLTLINALINAIPYVTDTANEWKHPRIFLAEGGDCDCASVAKYVLLRELGFAAKDLRITGLRIRGDTRIHAVTVARTGPDQFQLFLLDNRRDAVRTALYADEYTPLVSVNEEGVWLHRETAVKYVRPFANPVVKEH